MESAVDTGRRRPHLGAMSLAAALTAPTAVAAVQQDDGELVHAAARLTRDLNAARPAVYWADLGLSVGLGYGTLATAILAAPLALRAVAGVVAVLALYRALSFIHELTHLKPRDVPGFRFAWNAVVGVPLMAPSFMYEGVHNLHHARTRYGTELDPEYLPLASMRWWTLPLFVAASALAPLALILRFAVLAPLSALFPPLRREVVARFSALSIDPAFRRKPPEGAARRSWLAWETATSIYAVSLLTLLALGVVPLAAFGVFLAVASGVAVLNQVRTLAAHLWENSEGQAMTVTAQYLDTVNVPPPALLPALWAPVGLRYHALHHLLPGLPYHALGEAHRRLAAAMPEDSPYHRANHPGLPGLVARLARGGLVRA